MPRKLIFATNNQHKLAELRQIIGDRFQLFSLSDIDCHEDIPETAPTIEGNALMKARWLHERYNLDCFSDDTGLEVDALNGEPGVLSARYAGIEHDSERNIDKLLKNLESVPQPERTAHFRTVIALIMDGQEYTFEGRVNGEILTERHGQGGFGYDAVFHPFEDDRTFAQMSANEKNAISHRGRAVRKLIEFLNKNC